MPPKTARQLDRFSQFGLVAGRLALDDARPASRARTAAPQPGADRDLPRLGARRHRLRRGAARALPRARASARSRRTSRWPCSAARRRPTSASRSTCAGRSCRPPTRARRARSRSARRSGDLREGRVDAAIAGGCEIPLSPLAFGAFDIIRALSAGHNDDPGTPARPFDAGRDGFVMGEGAALLVLEAADVAERRGARPVRRAARLRRDVRRPPHGPAAGRRPRGGAGGDDRPRRRRRRRPTRSTTSTPTPRRRRSATSPRRGRSRWPSASGRRRVPVSGTKALYGHPLGASGAIEAAICALAIRDGWAPASVNLDEPDPDVAALLPGLLREGRDGTYRRVLSTSFGFGGLNAALVFGRRSTELSALGAAAAPGRQRLGGAALGRSRRDGDGSHRGPHGRSVGRHELEPAGAPRRKAPSPTASDSDAADRDRHGDARAPRRAPPISRPADRDRAGEDRRVDAHHPAAQVVRDGQLDRRVGGRGHRIAAEPDEDHQQRATTGNDGRHGEQRPRPTPRTIAPPAEPDRPRPATERQPQRRDQRADARRRHQEAVAGGAAAEDVAGRAPG